MNMFLELKLSDGLGNQLFQYATGRSLCVKNRIPFFLLNTDSFRNNPLGRKYGLNNFCISGKVIDSRFVHKLLRKDTRYNNLLKRVPGYKTVTEDVSVLQDLSTKTTIFTALQGYWQSEHYFKDIRPILLAELVPVNIHPLPHWTSEKNTVAVHVRRGDYLTETGIGALTKEYYDRAMDLIRNKVSDPLFVFFSDDIEWCKGVFRDQRIVHFEHKDWSEDYLQLFLMSKCKHQIIANSSFSWWGAWLNQNPDKLVIRAKTPFVNMAYVHTSYYPDAWISINN